MKWELKPLKQQLTTRTQKVRGWKLRNETTRVEFSELVEREARRQKQRTEPSAETKWQQFKETIMTAAKRVCGVSKGSCRERKTWIWNNEVKQAVTAKAQQFQNWYKTKTRADRERYMQARTEVRKAIASNARGVAERLEAMGKQARIFGEVRRIIGDRTDIGKTRLIKNSQGKILTNENEMMKAWTQYMEKSTERRKRKYADSPTSGSGIGTGTTHLS